VIFIQKKKRQKKKNTSVSHFSEEADGIKGIIISDIDKLHKAVCIATRISLDNAAKAAGISAARADELAHILEKKSLIKIHYGLLGRAMLYAKDYKEKSNLNTKK